MNGFERLQAADPAQEPDEVTLARLRRRLDGSPKRRWNPMSIAATFTAFAVIAGGGVAVGRVTAPESQPAATVSLSPGISGERSSDAKGGDADSSYYGWGGRTILRPAASLSDDSGVADGFTLTQDGVDKQAVLVKLADVIGAKGVLTNVENTISIGSNDGMTPVATMYDEPMLNFYGYNRDRSPWECVKEEDLRNYTKEGGTPPDMRVCGDEDLKPATKADAERAFTRVLNLLGLNANELTKSYVDTGSPQVVMLQGMAKVAGIDTNLAQLSVSVSGKGVFNISGFAARFQEVKGYDIVGAKTAANRSQLSKWIQLGPNPFGDWGAVYPMGRGEMGASTSSTFMVEGRPGVNAYIDTIDVSKARLGLVSYYTDNAMVLLPSWIFTADDGREWSMVALADKYVKFGR
jgi:hypothetical protein